MSRTILACLLAATLVTVVATGCGLRLSGRSQEPRDEFSGGFEDDLREDLRRDRGEGLGVDAKPTGPRARLQSAAELRREGRFQEAVDLYRDLLASSPPVDVRQQALFELGRTLSDPLNASRDADAALVALEELVRDFPDSEYASRARQRIEAIRDGT